jgi:hypothetical protein
MPASAAEPIWSLDREIVISRVFDAPRELVFRVWTEREHLTRWFGPRGFTCTTHEMEARVGAHEVLDRIRRRQLTLQLPRQAQPLHRERLVETLLGSRSTSSR